MALMVVGQIKIVKDDDRRENISIKFNKEMKQKKIFM